MKLLNEIWKARHPKDALFLSIIEGYNIKEYKEYYGYMIGDDILIYYHKKTKYTQISYDLIWSVFQTEFSLDYFEICELMCDMLKVHLKIEGVSLRKIIYSEFIRMGI